MRVQDRTPERLGPYRLIRRLGEGGMGVVYLGSDEAGQLVAVKALHPAMAREENARRRLAREVETMHRVRSCYVADVIGADLDGDPPYIVTRYVPGLTLDAVISASGPLTGPALARLARGLAEGLAAVHAAGVVHRDLKPGNVMIADGEPVVIDFGIAQVPETTRLTLTGMFMGTPGYLAPEVIGGKDSGTASDVHSYAATVAFAATGRPPFGTGAFETIFYRIMHGQPDLDTLPALLGPMIVRALARDPAARPSAAKLALWAASLDPALLVPSPPGQVPEMVAAGPGEPPGAAPHTLADQLPGSADGWPNPTRPLGIVAPDDVSDLLPPVQVPSWPAAPAIAAGPTVTAQGSRSAARPGAAVPARPAPPVGRPGPAAAGPDATPPGSSAIGPISAWSPLVIASVGVLTAVSMFAPLIGTAFALSVLLALRAASITGRQLVRRRSDGGSRSVGSIVAVALYPLALLRAAAVMLALLPIALLGAAIAAAVTVVVVTAHPLPHAVAFAAGALVAVVGFGPGSAGGRAALARFFTGAAGGTRGRLAVVYVGVLAIGAWATLTAWRQPTAYWPVSNPRLDLVHLPTLRGLLTDMRRSLLGLAHRFGL